MTDKPQSRNFNAGRARSESNPKGGANKQRPRQEGDFKQARQSSGRNARLAAARAVESVLTAQLALTDALNPMPVYRDLAARDRAFARLIAATTLRRLGQINAALAPYIKREPSPYVLAVLQTGAAQLLFLGTEAHAAVGESVAIVKRSRKQGDANAAGMVNAILRRVDEKGAALAAAVPPQGNLPDWLQESWRKSYGAENLSLMAAACLAQPPLDLTVKSDPDLWAQKLGARRLPSGSLRKDGIGDITKLTGFDEGAWWVQDVSAALPVQLLGDLSGKTALDMCAAPGGKTLQLAAAGADVTALDRSADRLVRVKQNLARTGLTAKTIAVDAAKWRGVRDHDFDVVLLDAPCSATGTLRRRPDVAWTKTQKDVDSLIGVQDTLLRAAARQVKAGGDLIYCTCSLETDEGEARIAAFLHDMPEFSLNSFLNPLGLDLSDGLTPEGYLRFLPHHNPEPVEEGQDVGRGRDGFFIARLTRNI